jgi:hypothetical protein
LRQLGITDKLVAPYLPGAAVFKSLTALLLLMVAASPVIADGTFDKNMTRADLDRYLDFDMIKAEALVEARKSGPAEKLDELDAALAGAALPLDSTFNLNGDWTCRMITLGGPIEIALLPEFPCRISDADPGSLWWKFETLAGPEMMTGTLYEDDPARRVFLGAVIGPNDTPRDYGKDPDTNLVAIVTRRAEDKLVFEFPGPEQGWSFAVLVLER